MKFKIYLSLIPIILSSSCWAYIFPHTIQCNFTTHICNLPHNAYNFYAGNFFDGQGVKTLTFYSATAYAKSIYATENFIHNTDMHIAIATYYSNNNVSYVQVYAGPNVYADSSYYNPNYSWVEMSSTDWSMQCSPTQINNPNACPITLNHS